MEPLSIKRLLKKIAGFGLNKISSKNQPLNLLGEQSGAFSVSRELNSELSLLSTIHNCLNIFIIQEFHLIWSVKVEYK